MRRIPEQYREVHTIRVTERMTVDFEETLPRLGRLHPVYATYWLGKHFELVSRKLTLPFLEVAEEGIGHELEVRHLAPALPGMLVELEAIHHATDGNRVHCRCRAVSELGDVVGEGSTLQVIAPKASLERRFSELRRRWEEHSGGANRPRSE